VTDLGRFQPLPGAARYITYALNDEVGSVVRAGAYLRQYRRTLPDPGERIPDEEVEDEQPDDDLLWFALKMIAMIAELPERLAAEEQGTWVRWAEAALRVWWKRQQEAS
jgi:hypothetical protein